MRVAANLALMFTDVPLLQRYEKAAKMGFKLIECPLPYSVPAEDLRREADKYGQVHVLINAPQGDTIGECGFAALPSYKDYYIETIATAIKYAKILSCPRIHIMAGTNAKNDKESHDLFVGNIRYAAEEFAKEGFECLIEPINQITRPGFYLRSLEQAEQIIEEINAPNLTILYDTFHIQQIHGQLTYTIKKYASKIGQIQIAQVGKKRAEPDYEGEIDYDYVFKVLKEVNPNWIVGCEYFNQGDTLEYVEWVKKYGLEF
uniref:Putative hydroxypyruvate isomerase n=1 Tax=Acrobeloides nanus TaxID=290746 RepID=A0A914DBR0_9BILA